MVGTSEIPRAGSDSGRPFMIARSTPSVAMVGAGPGGLAAAMLLAASGLRVRVYESQPVIGGRTSRIERGGYSFDRGPTFFLMPYVLDELFAATGRRLSDSAELVRLDPMYRLVVGQGDERAPIELNATQDLAEMARRIGAIEPRDAAGFARFVADNRVKLRLMEPILRSPIRSPLDLLKFRDPRLGMMLKPHLSVHSLSKQYFSHPAVQLAVGFQSKYLGMSPYECPSLFTILPFIEYEYGVWHPLGGCSALMESMADACTEMGVEFVTDAPVVRVIFEGKRAIGVVVKGQEMHHEQVVINADAAWAMKKLIPEALRGPEWSDARVDQKKYSCSTFMMYLGVRGELELPHHTIYISSKYQENLANISTHGRLSEDPSFYVCNPSRTDPTLAPEGCSSVYVLVPTPNTRSGIDWEQEKSRLRREALTQISRRLGVDLEDRIEVEELCTPHDWRGMNIQFGATFNLAHNLGQMLHKRPQHRMQGADGVWFVGGGTHPGSGLPVIFLSSQITARLLCEELGVAYAGDQLPRRGEMSTTGTMAAMLEPAHVS